MIFIPCCAEFHYPVYNWIYYNPPPGSLVQVTPTWGDRSSIPAEHVLWWWHRWQCAGTDCSPSASPATHCTQLFYDPAPGRQGLSGRFLMVQVFSHQPTSSLLWHFENVQNWGVENNDRNEAVLINHLCQNFSRFNCSTYCHKYFIFTNDKRQRTDVTDAGVLAVVGVWQDWDWAVVSRLSVAPPPVQTRSRHEAAASPQSTAWTRERDVTFNITPYRYASAGQQMILHTLYWH